jgi:hypothetical protein
MLQDIIIHTYGYKNPKYKMNLFYKVSYKKQDDTKQEVET